ncbi:MAG: ATP-binding protein [Cyanobacteria bacterium P01_A01_bin.114]
MGRQYQTQSLSSLHIIKRGFFVKRVLLFTIILWVVGHFLKFEVFESLAAFLQKYEAFEADEIFLILLILLPAALTDYCLVTWQRLKETNLSLLNTNTQLAQANRSKDELLSISKQAETKLRQTNQKLARATRLKDEFLATMSHELRTPLNTVLGMSEGLQEGIFGGLSAEQSRALQTIERSGSHLLELINDVLDVAKIEAGQIELNCAATPVVPLCQASLAFIRQRALQKRIQLKIKLSPQLPSLWVEERRIRQVLINLLDNAVKFTPEGGRITLAASCPDVTDTQAQPRLKISVTDTGIGIAPENMDKLFQPFVQIDSRLNRKYQGTGLGLALVKRIVKLHGGRVGATSKVGVGSRFTIELPCDQSAFTGAAFTDATFTALKPDLQPVPRPSPYSLEPVGSPLVLLAEDNEANISTLSSYLTAKGYRLLVAKTGQTAITLARAQRPDIILMDIQMPEMNGLEAIQRLRRDPTLGGIPMIALTALAMPGDRERCLAAGADEYLSKPFKLRQLTTAMQQLLVRQEASPC